MATSDPSTLDYAPPANINADRRSIIWTVLAIPTLIIPFVNFACDTSPVDALLKAKDNFATSNWSSDDFLPAMLAIGICLGGVAFLWRIRARLPWPTTAPERWTCITVAGLSVIGFLAAIVPAFHEMSDLLSIVALVIYLLTAALGTDVVVYARRRNTRDAVVLACLLGAFLAAAIYALVLFAGEHKKIGWYLTACVTPVTLIELISLAKFFPKVKPVGCDNDDALVILSAAKNLPNLAHAPDSSLRSE